MNTVYQLRPVAPTLSPYQMAKEATNVRASGHPVMDEINRCVGKYQVEIIVEEDNQTLSMFKYVPGLIAFIATIRSNGRIIGQGRGSACLSSTNRYIERAVFCAANSAIVDSIVRSTKVLNILLPNAGSALQDMEMRVDDVPFTDEPYSTREPYQAREEYAAKAYAPTGISEKQKVFLLGLIRKVRNADEKNQWLERMNGMSSHEASAAIQELKG